MPGATRPKVVIVGGGFGGLNAAKTLRDAPVDVLLVRADDIPEYVQDGVVDCGITGLDLVRERATHVEELLKLPELSYRGYRIWHDMSQNFYPFGYPFTFVANQVHQFILIFRKEE